MKLRHSYSVVQQWLLTVENQISLLRPQRCELIRVQLGRDNPTSGTLTPSGVFVHRITSTKHLRYILAVC